jgi:hypothetical protein
VWRLEEESERDVAFLFILFNLNGEYLMNKASDEVADLKIGGRIIINSPSVATDLRGTHDTSLGALPPLYSVESAHL